jgi:hypothetical protein
MKSNKMDCCFLRQLLINRFIIESTFINPAMKYFTIVIVRLDRTLQNLIKTLDSPIKSGNDEHKNFKCLLAV